jgi:adenylate cyclase
MDRPPRILIVDDTVQNIRLLEAVLGSRGYTLEIASSGAEALEKIESRPLDLILLDIVMPGMDGYEVCRRVRANPVTRLLPVVMITASGEQEKIKALEVGADDFIAKPFNQPELLARVKSLLRVKEYYDTVQAQAAELAEWNRLLETRVEAQVAELEGARRLRRFLSPQLADIIQSSGSDALLRSHRREVAVVFCDLRGFTSFAETAEPEELMGVLREYHDAMGALIHQFEGTVGHFAGDGIMVFFNDPLPCPNPSEQAVRMSVAMREQMETLGANWRRRGYVLGFGVGIALGYATLGQIGYEDRFDYAAIGTVTNLASRLCAEAHAGQILISQRVCTAVEDMVEIESVGELALKGLSKPVTTFNVVRLKETA